MKTGRIEMMYPDIHFRFIPSGEFIRHSLYLQSITDSGDMPQENRYRGSVFTVFSSLSSSRFIGIISLPRKECLLNICSGISFGSGVTELHHSLKSPIRADSILCIPNFAMVDFPFMEKLSGIRELRYSFSRSGRSHVCSDK